MYMSGGQLFQCWKVGHDWSGFKCRDTKLEIDPQCDRNQVLSNSVRVSRPWHFTFKPNRGFRSQRYVMQLSRQRFLIDLVAILTGRQEIEGEFTKPHTFLCKGSSRLTTTRDFSKSKLVHLGILGCYLKFLNFFFSKYLLTFRTQRHRHHLVSKNRRNHLQISCCCQPWGAFVWSLVTSPSKLKPCGLLAKSGCHGSRLDLLWTIVLEILL